MSVIKPMLAAEADLSNLKFPVYATPKLDGVRALITESGVMSRSWKRIPNTIVQAQFSQSHLIGLDGELIVGSPTAPDVYRQTQSVTSRGSDPAGIRATFYAFDLYDHDHVYEDRHRILQRFKDSHVNVRLVPSILCRNGDALLDVEDRYLNEGYEGLILRSPDGLYKNGRSTVKEGGMLKLKRFTDSEAEIIGMEEEMENRNEATKDAFGRTERSSHKENLVGKGRMGALIVRDVNTKVEFKIGTGFDAADRELFWETNKHAIVPGVIVKYKHFAIGAKDKPRFPTYLGLREDFDR